MVDRHSGTEMMPVGPGGSLAVNSVLVASLVCMCVDFNQIRARKCY